LCSAISFYANKNITSGEGGAFFTNDQSLYDYMVKMYSHGMTSTRYIHDMPAWNFRMTNVQAALLYDQLCDIETIKNYKKECFNRYTNLLYQYQTNKNVEVCKPLKILPNCIGSYWMYVVTIDTVKTYEQIEKEMKDYGVEIRPMFYSVKYHLHLKELDTSLINKKDYIQNNKIIIMLPSSPLITLEEQEKVVSSLLQII
jgi:perosamine synthetase